MKHVVVGIALMWPKIIAIITILSLLGGLLAGFNKWKVDIQNAATEKVVLQLKISEEKDARLAVEKSLIMQRETIKIMDLEKQKINRQIKEYLSIFKKHDLTRLARAKPGMIEKRINEATKKIFQELENETNQTNQN